LVKKQIQGFSNKVPIYNDIFDTFYKIINTEGFLVTQIRFFPCLAVQFWCLKMVKMFN